LFAITSSKAVERPSLSWRAVFAFLTIAIVGFPQSVYWTYWTFRGT